MNLELYFRLIATTVHQVGKYENSFFLCPRIVCVDGFSVSLQISKGSYCASENGYRKFGFNFQSVEYGFPSEYEQLLASNDSVGSIDVVDIQNICDSHGGIDWQKTISKEACESLLI